MSRRPREQSPPKATKAEEAYIQDMQRRSAFDMLDSGQARILSPDEYPEPIKRLRSQRRRMLHLTLRPSVLRTLRQRSRKSGLPVERIAVEWIEERSRREAS